MLTIDKDVFFAGLKALFPIGPTQSQKDGFDAIFEAWAKDGDDDLHKLAYVNGTAYWETGRTMQPIDERGSHAYFAKYDTGRLAKALGNTPEADGDGDLFHGRGDVQLTGRRNYTLASKKLGVDLVKNPELAKDPVLAARVIVVGMRDGWFTGKKLANYFGAKVDWENARRIVNGTDRAAQIASYSKVIFSALLLAVKATPAQAAKVAPREETPAPPLAQSTIAKAASGISVGSVVVVAKEAINYANTTTQQVTDVVTQANGTLEQVQNTISVVKTTSGSFTGVISSILSPPVLIAVGVVILALAGYVIYRRWKMQTTLGV